MGLLDSLFNSDSYGGQQAGLLDFLRQMQMQQQNYQPSAGFPAAPSSATFGERFNAMPQPQAPVPELPPAQTIAPAPQPAALPPQQNYAPPQGQMPTDVSAQSRQPQQQGLPPALGGRSGGDFLGNLSSAFQSIGNGGGLISALSGHPNDPTSIAQQDRRAQYQAFIGAGLSPQNAMLAVLNPEAGKVLVQQALSTKQKWGVISKDPLEGEKYGFIGETDQTINGKPYNPQSAPAGSAGASGGFQDLADKLTTMRTQGATTAQLLAQIPPGYRDDINSLITGKAVPANMGRAQSRMALLTLAKIVDPNFDETMIPARVQMRKDFAGEGKNGQAIGAFNTVQHHAGQVSDAIAEFEKAGGGSNYPLWNAAKLMVANNTAANPQLRDAAQKLQDKLNATEHEVATAYNSGHITDSDRKTWNEIKASNLPANQLKQKLDDFVELLNGKRDSLNHMHQQMFHQDAPTIDKESNAAITNKIHQRLPEYAGGAATATPDRAAVEAEMRRRGLLK